MPTPTPAQDLKEKLKLEEKLKPVLRRYNAEVVKEFTQTYAESGDILNIAEFNAVLDKILSEHYIEVSDVFSDRIKLPSDVAKTEEESDLIVEALFIWIASRTPVAAQRINATTQEQILDAVDFGSQEPAARELVGREAQLTIAAFAGNKLRQDLAGRESGILMTETQIPAEAAKATELDVLIGEPPAISGGTTRPSAIKKEWVTVGDARVREGHLAADGQKVSTNDPFIVGGEALRWPGDAQLGASLGNIINCRCSSIVSTKDIINERRN